MNSKTKMTSQAIGLMLALTGAGAQADEPANLVTFGWAGAHFNIKSGDLSGPPGTTPPGIQVGLKQSDLLALSYQRRLSDDWSVVVLGGTPPTLKIYAEGTAAALGQIASARIWYPTLLGKYNSPRLGASGLRFDVGAGVNYTFYTKEQSFANYTSAVSGSSSELHLTSSWGPVVLLGAEMPVAQDWSVHLSYLRYWIKTTAHIDTVTPTPGGPVTIQRTVGVKANPDVIALSLGYHF